MYIVVLVLLGLGLIRQGVRGGKESGVQGVKKTDGQVFRGPRSQGVK